MNHSHMHDLMSDDVMILQCTFHPNGKRYTYKCLVSDNVEVGNTVLILAPDFDSENEARVVKTVDVVETLLPCDFNFEDAKYSIRWIIGKVNYEEYEARTNREQRFVSELNKLRTNQLKKNTMQLLTETYGTDAVGRLTSTIKG